MTASPPRKVLFVCTGNICRSPAAEVIATTLARTLVDQQGRSLGDRYRFSSAGTASWHVGDDMDPRARLALEEAGFDPPLHAARHATDQLLADSHLVIALDRKHLEILKGRVRGTEEPPTLALLRPFDPRHGGAHDVADPYYGGPEDFTRCVDVVSSATGGLLRALNDDEVFER